MPPEHRLHWVGSCLTDSSYPWHGARISRLRQLLPDLGAWPRNKSTGVGVHCVPNPEKAPPAGGRG